MESERRRLAERFAGDTDAVRGAALRFSSGAQTYAAGRDMSRHGLSSEWLDACRRFEEAAADFGVLLDGEALLGHAHLSDAAEEIREEMFFASCWLVQIAARDFSRRRELIALAQRLAALLRAMSSVHESAGRPAVRSIEPPTVRGMPAPPHRPLVAHGPPLTPWGIEGESHAVQHADALGTDRHPEGLVAAV